MPKKVWRFWIKRNYRSSHEAPTGGFARMTVADNISIWKSGTLRQFSHRKIDKE